MDLSRDHLEIGKYLGEIREQAGIKQADLAKRITWSPAVLSRVESGERPVDPDELALILGEIGTTAAKSLAIALGRDWKIIPRPALGHPDSDLLWEAETVAQELSVHRESPNLRKAFDRRLSEYIDELRRVAQLLLNQNHQIAFVGSIGVGKSTAICSLTKLQIPGNEIGSWSPALETGGGGITICEVHLKTGPEFGIIVEPKSDDEIRSDVTDFAEYVLGSNVSTQSSDELESSQGISKEIERAIRNMSALGFQKKEKGALGRVDKAKELAQSFASARELVVEVLSRMALHRRDTRDLWYDPRSGKTPLVWLKESFELINNGRHPLVSLPRRIEIVIPQKLFGNSSLSFRIVDTKGIDRTAARADIESHLDDPHTISVLCTGFNNAPASELRLLLERAKEGGARNLASNVCLLVLPRPNEAMAMKDEGGNKAENAEDGYELKDEQIRLALKPLNLSSLPIVFFNAYSEKPSRLEDALVEQVEAVRAGFRASISEVSAGAKSLLINHEQAQAQEVRRAAARLIAEWVQSHKDFDPSSAHVRDSLMTELRQAHASTVRASVRREGKWPNLNYTHHLGYGARRLAALALGKYVDSFSDFCATLGKSADYAEASDLIQQSNRLLVSSYEDLLKKMQVAGQAIFADELSTAAEFWNMLDNEWGRGSGYKGRVAGHNEQWFTQNARLTSEQELLGLVQGEWGEALNRVRALFEEDR